MADESDVSPTGAPVLPQVAVKVAAAVVGLAGVLVNYLPSHTVAFRVCTVLVGLGGALGIVSQGVRR